MIHHAIAYPGGFVCAYQRPMGELCAVSEHPTRESAQQAAAKLNYQHRARMAQAQATRWREHAIARRPVRWFEPDQFA